MPGTHKIPKMGHEPKMEHKPKAMSDAQKAAGKKLTEKLADKFGFDLVKKENMENSRAKMAYPKMNDDKNFTKMSQEMAAMLVPKMDHAKMYKPTKYHDGPKMGHEPKMNHGPKMDHGPKMGHKPKAYHDKK